MEKVKEKKFEIELPELKIKEEQREKEIRAMFQNDFERKGILTQTLVFTYLNEPISVTELADKLTDYYKLIHDRANVFRALQKLVKLGLLYTTTSGYVLTMGYQEQKEIHRMILAKFKQFLSRIPEAFKKRYSDVNFFWAANGEGIKYIEWCCKLLGFKCEKI